MNLHAIDDARTIRDDGVLADDARSDVHAIVGAAHDRAVADARSPADFAIVHHHGIRNLLRSRNFHVVADDAPLGHIALYVLVDEAADALLDGLVVEMLHHEGGELAVQVGEKDGIAVASLVQHTDQVALSIGCPLCRLHDGEVRDEAIIADSVVVDVAGNVFYQAVIANNDIA